MIIGARTGVWAKSGGGVPTARDYVSNVAIFDAKENAGFGVFNNSQEFWSDCLHESRVLSLVGGSPDWRELFYKLDGTRYFTTNDSVYQDLINTKVFTIEILVRAFIGRSNGGLLCIGEQPNRNFWMWERNNSIYTTDPYIDEIQTQFGNFKRPYGAYDMWHSYVFVADGSSLSLYVDGLFFQKITMLNTTRNNQGMDIGSLGFYGKAGCGYSCLRFSDFAMTDEQRLSEYSIDKARFRIP